MTSAAERHLLEQRIRQLEDVVGDIERGLSKKERRLRDEFAAAAMQALTPGMYVGQMIFYRVTEVPEHRSYATIGRYNNDASVQTVKP